MNDPKIDIYFLVFSLIILFAALIFILVSFFGYYRKKQRSNFIEKEELKVKFHEELLRTQLEIQEQTLKTLSMEIHDNIGQVLSLAKLNLATFKINDSFEAQKIESSKILISKAIQDLRNLSKSLNTDYVIEMGFVASVQYELEMLNKAGSFEANITISGDVRKLEPEKELILFRIVQEVLNNIIKHAQASIITISIIYDKNNLLVSISDNGIGFDIVSLHLKGKKQIGIGLKNMNSRAAIIGAAFNISSDVGKGTRADILMHFPNTIA